MATLSSGDLPDQELAAQVVPQPNRDAVAKWLFEIRFPDHKGYWDAGHTPERTKGQFREKAAELAALSAAPLTIDRGALAEVCQDAMRDAMNTFGPYSSSPQGKFIADAVIAHLTEHDRQVAAKAWDEGYRTCDQVWVETADIVTPDEDRTDPSNPYRQTALGGAA